MSSRYCVLFLEHSVNNSGIVCRSQYAMYASPITHLTSHCNSMAGTCTWPQNGIFGEYTQLKVYWVDKRYSNYTEIRKIEASTNPNDDETDLNLNNMLGIKNKKTFNIRRRKLEGKKLKHRETIFQRLALPSSPVTSTPPSQRCNRYRESVYENFDSFLKINKWNSVKLRLRKTDTKPRQITLHPPIHTICFSGGKPSIPSSAIPENHIATISPTNSVIRKENQLSANSPDENWKPYTHKYKLLLSSP